MRLLDEVRSFIKGVFTSTQNFQTHITKWGTHGRLGGLIKYRSQEVDELRKVNLTYRECILYNRKPADNNSEKIFTVLNVNEESCPVANADAIYGCFAFDAFRKHGDFMTNFRCVFDLIKACVYQRFESFAATGYTHVNTAVILFCAEFSAWLSDMAKQEAKEEMLQEIKDRIHYLNRIEEERPFKEEAKTDYSIYLLIYNINVLLERLIQPEIEAILNEKRSRDYFKQLFTASTDFFDAITRGLFCIYTDDIQSSSAFHIDSIRLITNQQLEKTLSTHFGQCFVQLAKNCEVSHWSKNTIEAKFNDERGIPLESEIFTLLSENSGVCQPFRTKEKVRPLLNLLGLLYDFSIFISSVKQAYALSGIGGDILVYIGLCQETRALIRTFSDITDEISSNLSQIREDADSYHLSLLRKQEESPWQVNYSKSKQNFNEAMGRLEKAYEAVNQISIGMQKVSSKKYLQEVNQKIQNFQQTITYLRQRMTSATSFSLEENKEVRNVQRISSSPREGTLPFFSSQMLMDRQRALSEQYHKSQEDKRLLLDNNT